MIWKIARKDLLLNLMTFKFLAGTIVCVVLTSEKERAVLHRAVRQRNEGAVVASRNVDQPVRLGTLTGSGLSQRFAGIWN